MAEKNGFKKPTPTPIVKVTVEHLDSMNKYNDFFDRYNKSIQDQDRITTYSMMTELVEGWNLPGDHKNPADYGELHPLDFAAVQKAVKKASNSFFQD